MKTRTMYIIGIVTFAFLGVALLLTTLSASAASTAAAPVAFVWRDNFMTSTLNTRWSWIREDPINWSLTAKPNYLVITTTIPLTANILVQPAPPGEYYIETHLFFTPTQDLQSAGLVVYQDDSHFLTLSRAFCAKTTNPKCVGNGVYFDYAVNGDVFGANLLTGTITTTTNLYLKVVRIGNVYTGSVSTSGISNTFTTVGVYTTTINPTKIGLRSSNQGKNAPGIPADFKFFTLSDRSFRLQMPMIFKQP